jgi:hypothetical protein
VKSVEPPLAISSNSAGGSLSFLNHNKSNDRSGGKNESSESTSNDNKSQEKIKGMNPITVEKKLQTKAALISAKGFKPFILDKAANTRQKMNAKYLKSQGSLTVLKRPHKKGATVTGLGSIKMGDASLTGTIGQ